MVEVEDRECSVCKCTFYTSDLKPYQCVCYTCRETYPQLKAHYEGKYKQPLPAKSLIKTKIHYTGKLRHNDFLKY